MVDDASCSMMMVGCGCRLLDGISSSLCMRVLLRFAWWLGRQVWEGVAGRADIEVGVDGRGRVNETSADRESRHT